MFKQLKLFKKKPKPNFEIDENRFYMSIIDDEGNFVVDFETKEQRDEFKERIKLEYRKIKYFLPYGMSGEF